MLAHSPYRVKQFGMRNAEFESRIPEQIAAEDTENHGEHGVKSSNSFSVTSVLFLCDSVVGSFRNPHQTGLTSRL